MREKLSMEQLNRKTVEEFKAAKKNPIIVIADNIRSMNNIGSIFRTCDAFLVEEFILCGITPTPPHREIQKTALGATESVKWSYDKSTSEVVKRLHDNGYKVLAAEQAKNSTMLNELKLDKGEKVAIVLGNEVDGVSQEVVDMCDDCVEIPQFGTKHSLNVCNSCAIVLWQIFCLTR